METTPSQKKSELRAADLLQALKITFWHALRTKIEPDRNDLQVLIRTGALLDIKAGRNRVFTESDLHIHVIYTYLKRVGFNPKAAADLATRAAGFPDWMYAYPDGDSWAVFRTKPIEPIYNGEFVVSAYLGHLTRAAQFAFETITTDRRHS